MDGGTKDTVIEVMIFKTKIELPSFDGHLNSEEYLDWEPHVETFFLTI